MTTGLIFDLQHFSTHDGPGIRTTVFLKGCALSCPWCHNPEGVSPRPEVFYSRSICSGCGTCITECDAKAHSIRDGVHRFERGKCELCFQCTKTCPTGALEVTGKEMTAEMVMSEVRRDRIFYEESGGGLTISGGEPLLQFEFTKSLLELADSEGINACVETSGWGEPRHFEKIQPLVGLFLWDIKSTDDSSHKALVGVDLKPLLQNLRLVDSRGGKTRLRCIVLAGVNLTEAHFDRVAEIYRSLRNCQGVELLPYHPLGNSKASRLGMKVDSHNGWIPSQQEMDAACKRFADKWKVPVFMNRAHG